MARPTKEGIDYFPIDLDIMEEGSVGYVDAKYGVMAFGLLVRLLMRIYRNGYYLMWTEREQYLFMKDINVDINETRTIVNAYINEGFFNKNLYEQYGILTSHGIQKRYLKACERRSKIVMIKEYYLIDAAKDDVKTNNVTLIRVNVDKNPSSQGVNVDIESAKTPQSKVKESKVKESKQTIRAREDKKPVDNFANGLDEVAAPDESSGDESAGDDNPDFMSFWNAYPKRMGMPRAMEAWRAMMDKGVNPKYLVSAAKKYALEVIADKTEMNFVKMPHNFLLEKKFYEYLPRNIPECPRCHGEGNYPDDDGSVIICDCRKVLFPDYGTVVGAS